MSITAELDIINAALVLIGEPTISDINDAKNETARKVKVRWPILRDGLLRLHPWNCTRERAVLIKDSVAPLFGFAYKYPLPADPYCIRPLAIQYTNDGDFISLDNTSFGGTRSLQYQFAIEGRYLLTNTEGTTENSLEQEGINLLYSCRPSNDSVSTYDAMLIELLTIKLAAELAFPLTGSKALGVSFMEDFKELVKVARSTNAQEICPGIPIGDVLGVFN
jgi:hypothetical protein